MKKILLLDDDENILEILQMLIESEMDNEIVKARSVKEAIELLGRESNVGLIISDFFLEGETCLDFFNFNVDNKNHPFLLTTGSSLEDLDEMKDFQLKNEYNKLISKPYDPSFILDAIKDALQGNDVTTTENTTEYIRVRIDYILKYLKDYGKVFLRLSKEKFVKIVDEANGQDDEILLRYKEKGKNYVYLEKAQFKTFSKELTKEFIKDIETAENSQKAVEATGNILSIMEETTSILGLGEEDVKIIEDTSQKIINNLSKEKDLANLIDTYCMDKGYLVSHSTSCIPICYLIIKGLAFDTKNFSQELLETLSYASLLHDATLMGTELASHIDIETKEFQLLTVEERNKIKEHPFEIVELAQSIGHVPRDAVNLLYEHHERPDGKGFPRQLEASSISIESAIFIVALRSAHYFYNNGPTVESLFSWRNELQQDYFVGNFKKVSQILIRQLEVKAKKAS